MLDAFDPGYGTEPFRTLCSNYPDASVYPQADFRVEWGPIFHRGRLDGTARVLVIGQDPSHNEAIVRRILVGEAGRRTQGLLAKLGITRSYAMVNTFLYSVYGQQGGERHKNDPKIAGYRNEWLHALLASGEIEAVIALGGLADDAWQNWRQTPAGKKCDVAYAHVIHPTQPESSSKDNAAKLAAALKAMLQNWNTALNQLYPSVVHPDEKVSLVPYGDDFKPDERADIPSFDLPAGLPEWMRNQDGWAKRAGSSAQQIRANITITVPASAFA